MDSRSSIEEEEEEERVDDTATGPEAVADTANDDAAAAPISMRLFVCLAAGDCVGLFVDLRAAFGLSFVFEALEAVPAR